MNKTKMKRNGNLIVISGFSGVGKGTIVKKLVEEYGYALSISATSRNKRDGEVDGREYFFLTREEFSSRIKRSGFIEWAEYVGNFYGTPRDYVEEKLKEGIDVILEIEPQGAMKIKENYKEAILIFIVPPSAAELESRLVKRGTETREVIDRRLKRALSEIIYLEKYDYIVVNDNLEVATDDINHIIKSTLNKREYISEFLDALAKDMEESFKIFS